MGLKDLLKKALTGASDEDNRKNKAKMREIFNSLVADGDAYTLIYCHMENSHNASLWRSMCAATTLWATSRVKL